MIDTTGDLLLVIFSVTACALAIIFLTTMCVIAMRRSNNTDRKVDL